MLNPLWWIFLTIELVNFFDESISKTNRKRSRK